MKQYNRIIALILALMLSLSLLTACGSTPADQPVDDPQPEQSQPVEDQSGDAQQEEAPAENFTTEEVAFYRDDLQIYAQLMIPEGEGPFPVVILSHGYGGNHKQCLSNAKLLASQGVAACAFDFNGGGRGSQSAGDTKDMSVLTEAEDLSAVMDGLAAMPEIDASNMVLWGFSQGGFVSTYVATTRPDDVKALVCYFPSYVLHDDAAKAMPDPNNIPEEMEFMGLTIGRCYYADALSFNIYDMMPNYTGDVLLFHGTKDILVPIEYSQRAAEVFPSVELVTVQDGAHGDLGPDASGQAVEFILEHVK